MSTWQSCFVQTNSIRLHLTRTGGVKPPLVLSHGVTDDGLCWSPVAEILSASYDVIMVDARGHGLSDAPESGYDPLTQAEDLAGVLRALRLDKALLIGHSMGAVTTLVTAALHPGLPEAIVLEDPPAWWLPPTDRAAATVVTQEIKNWAAHIRSLKREEILAEGRHNSPHWSEAELEPWADSKQRFSPNIIDGVFSSKVSRGLDWANLLKSVTCPLLALAADPKFGAALSPEGLRALQGYIPHMQSVNFPGSGHNIRREAFDKYLREVQGFLARL